MIMGAWKVQNLQGGAEGWGPKEQWLLQLKSKSYETENPALLAAELLMVRLPGLEV